MEEMAPRHLAALDFLLEKFGTAPFTVDEASRFMHRNIVMELEELGILKSSGKNTLRLGEAIPSTKVSIPA